MYKKFFLSFIKISFNNVGQRLDNFLFSKIKCIPKCKIYSLIRKGNIRINNKRISYKYRLNLNDILRIPLISFNLKIKKLDLNKNIINKFNSKIIYEDNYLVLINKISGISVHSSNKDFFNLIDIYRSIINTKYLNLIHRLDKYSSGLLLLSKNRNILIKLCNDFKYKNIIKKYILLVCGKWPKNLIKVSSYLIKSKYRGYTFNNNNNKNYILNKNYKFSLTYFRVIDYINNFTLLEAIPVTGRFHQIRLHVSSKGYPILFDNIYGNIYLNNKFYILNKSRLFLHCSYISFFHYFLNKKLEFYSKLDSDLCYILYNIKNNNYKV